MTGITLDVRPAGIKHIEPSESDVWDEVSEALDHQRHEMQCHFQSWLAELKRMQQEHSTDSARLAELVQRGKPRQRSPDVFWASSERFHKAAKPLSSTGEQQVHATWQTSNDNKNASQAKDQEHKDHPCVVPSPNGSWLTPRGEDTDEKNISHASKLSVQKADIFPLESKRVEDTDKDASLIRRFVRGAYFRGFCSVTILLNAIFMGVQAEMMLSTLMDPTQKMDPFWEQAELAFCVCFAAELVLRFMAERLDFCKAEEAWWNLFDTVLVVLSIVDVLLNEFTHSGRTNLTFARTLRVFRFARILRIVRVMRFFYSFRLMVYSIVYSIVSLLWVFVLLLFIMYFFTIFFLNGVSEHFRDTDDLTSELSQDLKKKYGTLFSTLVHLFMGICGGIDWGELMDPLNEISWVYGWIFLFYIFFMIFGVLNVVIASFVDSASQISRRDRELSTQNEIMKNQEYAQNIRRFFHEADIDGTGTLTWEEFQKYLEHERVQAYFQSFELDVSQARTLFKLLDLDESNDVGIDEFVQGCMRMKGQSRSIDVNMLLYETEKMMKRQGQFFDYVTHQFELLCKGTGIKPVDASHYRWRSSTESIRRMDGHTDVATSVPTIVLPEEASTGGHGVVVVAPSVAKRQTAAQSREAFLLRVPGHVDHIQGSRRSSFMMEEDV